MYCALASNFIHNLHNNSLQLVPGFYDLSLPGNSIGRFPQNTVEVQPAQVTHLSLVRESYRKGSNDWWVPKIGRWFHNLKSLRFDSASLEHPACLKLEKFELANATEELTFYGTTVSGFARVASFKHVRKLHLIHADVFDWDKVIPALEHLHELTFIVRNSYLGNLDLTNLVELRSLTFHPDDSDHRIEECSLIGLSNLVNLTKLDIKFNYWRHLPQDITKLVQLEQLHVSGLIPELPHNLFEVLTNLEKLHVHLRRIEQLPDNIDRLQKLRVLHIRGKTRLPSTISTIATLRWLCMPDMMAVPESMVTNCVKLTQPGRDTDNWPVAHHRLLNQLQMRLRCPAPLVILVIRWINGHRDMFERDRDKLPMPSELIECIKVP